MPGGADWASLPTDLHLGVLSVLDLEGRCCYRGVCHGWRQSALALPQLWRELSWDAPVVLEEPQARRRFGSFFSALPALCHGGTAQLRISAIWDMSEETFHNTAISESEPEPWVNLAAALAAAAPTLTDVRLRIPGEPPGCAWLACLLRCRRLELAFPNVIVHDLLTVVAQLPQLEELEIELNLYFFQGEQRQGQPEPGMVQGSDPLPPGLRRLRLSGCCCEELPAQLSRLSGLTCLQLDNNYLIEGVLPLLPALRVLDLSMALQYELPKGIDRLTTLTELRATGEALDWGLEDIQGLPLLERLTVALSGVVPDVLNTLPRLAHLDLSNSHGGMLTADLPLLTQLTYLEAGWSQLEHPAAVLATCTCLAVFRAFNGYQNRHNFATCAPAGRRVAGALRALSTLCQLEEVEVPMACMREPGVEEAHAALAELRAARPALRFIDAEFHGTDREDGGEGSQGEEG